ncbi:MAG: sigma 54-interacting transcriptional regulator [Clostridiales bacterium]
MKISDLNYWECDWYRDKNTITKKEFLASESTYFVFGNGESEDFTLFNRGDISDSFLRTGEDSICPLEQIKSVNYIAFYLDQELSTLACYGNDNKCGLILNEWQHPVAVVSDIWNLYYLSYSWRRESYHQNLRIEFYKRIIDNIEEEIFITDEYGFIQFLNPHAEKVCGIKLRDIIGSHVEDLEKQGIISSSISKEVFKYNKTCNKLMEMHTGHAVVATGIPLYNKSGKLINVLVSSKDVAEIRDILTHLQDVTTELGQKDLQIEELKKKVITQDNYVLQSSPMQEVEKSILKVAPTDATVLIDGESGAGKEIVAELLYKLGSRSDKPFVKINCGMIPEHLLESEFFGYEPGAFTGASKTGKKGKIEIANGGTLFFDELGEMPLSLQAKILEFLQDRNIVRVGGMKRIPVDVRVIAATNRNLIEMVREGTFRGDLYYRLNVMPIHVSPLRERSEDILPLTRMFLQKYNARYGKSKTIAPSVLTYFIHYKWPGNVRELMHTIERLLIISDGDVITMDSVNKVFAYDEPMAEENNITSLKLAKQTMELAMVKKAYETYRSSYKAAEALGVTQPAVMKILKRSGYRLHQGVLVKIDKTP